MSNNVVVHIVDDEISVRQSMAFLVSTAGYAVRMHDSAASFLEAHPYPAGHCLITDLRMPGMDGVALLKQVRESGSSIPAIVVTGHGDVPMAVSAMKVGAVDFIEKPFEGAVLLDALERIASDAEHARDEDHEHGLVMDRLMSLSERERQVFDGVVAGKANKTIAHEQDLSPRTVEVYRANVMAKLHAKSLPELVLMALAAGITIDHDRLA